MWSDLFDFLYENGAMHYAIIAPFKGNYFTVLKVYTDIGDGLTDNVLNFIANHIGKVDEFHNEGDKFNFVVDNVTYSMFSYDSGIVSV